MGEDTKAYQLLIEGKYEEAKEILEKLVEENPKEHNLFNLALSLYKLERFEEALEILDKLLSINEEHKKALFLKGVILRRLAQLEEAKKIFSKVGFVELAEAMPEILEKPSPLEIKPETKQKEFFQEEAEQKEPVLTDLTEENKVLRMKVDGSFEVEKGFFIAFITEKGRISETHGLITGDGKGELVLSCCKIKEGEITKDKGEGQLSVNLKDETFIIKVNPQEDIFFQASFMINWTKG